LGVLAAITREKVDPELHAETRYKARGAAPTRYQYAKKVARNLLLVGHSAAADGIALHIAGWCLPCDPAETTCRAESGYEDCTICRGHLWAIGGPAPEIRRNA